MTDGGLETTLIYQDGFDLPEFAAVDLLRSERGTVALRSYYTRYAIASLTRFRARVRRGASPAWATRLGYSASELERLNCRAISLMEEIRDRYEPLTLRS